MATPGSDGSIILTTKVDESGIEQWMNKIAKSTNKTTQATDDATKATKKYGEQTRNSTKTAKTAFESMGKKIKEVASYLGLVFGVKAFFDFSKQAGQMATQTEASIQRLIDIYGEASQTVGDYIDMNARAIGMSKSAAASFSSVYGNLFSVWADQKTNAELTTKYLNMTAVVASKTGRTAEDVQERVRSGLLGNTEAIEDLGIFVNVKTIEMTEAFKKLANGRSWEQLNAYEQSQVRTLAIMEQATKKYGDQVEETTALTRARYNAAYQDMQATWGQFVNTVLMPVLKVATAIMNVITQGMQAIAGLTGKTISASQRQASNMEATSNAIGGAVDNQEDLTKAVKGTAKEQKKFTAGFDELNTIGSNSSDSSGGSGSGASSVGGGVGTMPDFGGGGDGGLTQKIDAALTYIMGIAGAALMAIGLLVLFSGNIPWGIGFIIAGAALFSVSAAALTSGDVSQNAANALSALMGIAGGALIALGIMLLFLGSTAWGIGFIIAGAATLGVGIATIVKFGTGDIQQTIMMIEGIAAGALLALGIILLVFNGANPLSIGLIAAGAALLSITVAQIVAGQVSEEVAKWIHIITTIVSAALLVLGAVLFFTGAAKGLGLGLLIAGAAGLAGEVALNWDYIIQALQGPLGLALGLIGGFLVVLGIIILFASGGTALPLGLGLLVAGGVSLAAAIAPNWNFLVDKIKGVWKTIKDYWKQHIAKYFTAKWWGDLAKGAIKGFITWIINGLNKLINKINSFGFDLPDVLGGGHVGFNIQTIKVPALAKGAVIPPNREFLAVLGDQKRGTNIEAPADLIKQMVNEALNERGYSGSGDITINFTGNLAQLARVLKPQLDKETTRKGAKLVIGGAH